MRYHTVKDRESAVCECELCGAEIYGGEYYCLNGQIICPDCLEEYARHYFAPYLCLGGEEWR